MAAIGLRCSTKEFYYTVLRGTIAAPEVVTTNRVPYPRNRSPPGLLHWAAQEFHDLYQREKVTAVAVKRAEGGRAAPSIARIEIEAIALEAAVRAGIPSIRSVRKAQIRKLLSFSGKARYVTSRALPGSIQGDATKDASARDATAAALSMLSEELNDATEI